MYKQTEDGKTVTHLSKVEARGGSRTVITRNILIVSLALVVLLLTVSLGFGFFETDRTGADTVNTDQAAPAASQ